MGNQGAITAINASHSDEPGSTGWRVGCWDNEWVDPCGAWRESEATEEQEKEVEGVIKKTDCKTVPRNYTKGAREQGNGHCPRQD